MPITTGCQLKIPAVYIGPIFLRDLSITYRRSDDTWGGGAEVCLPGCLYSLDGAAGGDFGFGLRHGKFDHAGFGLKFGLGARPQLFPSLFLTHVGFALGLHPLRLTGKIGVSEANIVDIDGAVLAAFASPSQPYYIPDDITPEIQPLAGRRLDSFTLALGGTANIKVPALGGSLPLAHGFAIYQAPDYFEFGGGVDYRITFLELSGGLSGFVFPSQKKFNLEGGVKACLRGIEIGYKFVSVKLSLCVKVGAVVSSAGAGLGAVFPVPFPIFGTIPIVVGAGVHWGKSPDLMLFSCDYGKYRETSPKAAHEAGASRAAYVPAGLPAEMIRVRGDGAAPEVTVRGPDGRPVTANPDAVIVKLEAQQTTLIALRHPRAGRWMLSAAPGSAPIADVATADALAPLRIRARVLTRRGRGVLRYSLTAAAGRTVTFIERGPHTSRVLGVARARTRAITFTPGPGGRGRRAIIALIDGAAGPARSLTVASYLVPALRRPR